MASNTESVGAEAATPTDVGLKREMGFIGATWASETSIIGSGWLFGAFLAAQAAGHRALLGWIIAGVIVIILALVHAELGGMYPVSGGTAQVPALRVRQHRGHLVRLLLLAPGSHRRADRVLRGHAVRLVLLARPVRLEHEATSPGSASR